MVCVRTESAKHPSVVPMLTRRTEAAAHLTKGRRLAGQRMSAYESMVFAANPPRAMPLIPQQNSLRAPRHFKHCWLRMLNI